jgi:hypothetical protein
MSSVQRYTEDVLLRNTNYRLRGRETWIDVKNLCVKVSRCDTGVEISIYPEVDEGFGEPLVTLFRAFPELDEDLVKPRKNFQSKRPTSKGFSLTKFMNRN